MKEEIIVSGRNNPLIDPVLNIWHWQIPLYLFLGGLAAGILFFAALFKIQGKEDWKRHGLSPDHKTGRNGPGFQATGAENC